MMEFRYDLGPYLFIYLFNNIFMLLEIMKGEDFDATYIQILRRETKHLENSAPFPPLFVRT